MDLTATNVIVALIVRFRAASGLSQADMGEQLGYSANFMSQVERGERPLSGEFVRRLAAEYPELWRRVAPIRLAEFAESIGFPALRHWDGLLELQEALRESVSSARASGLGAAANLIAIQSLSKGLVSVVEGLEGADPDGVMRSLASAINQAALDEAIKNAKSDEEG